MAYVHREKEITAGGINFNDFTYEELQTIANTVKHYKKFLMVDEVPIGEENAKTAKEIFGDKWQYFTNNLGKLEMMYGIKSVERKETKVYVNFANPKDIITITKKRKYYFREE